MHKLQAVIPDWDLNPHTVIIGGGPATLCFLIQMLRKGRLNDMLKDESFVILDKGEFFGSGHYHQKVERDVRKPFVYNQLVVSCNYSGLELTRLILKDPYYKQRDIFDSLFSSQPNKQQNDSSQNMSTIKSNLSKKDGSKESDSQTKLNKENQRTSLKFKSKINVFVNAARANSFFEEAVLGAFKEIISTQTFQELIKYGRDFPPTSLFSYYLRIVGNTLLRYIYTMKQRVVFKAYRFVRQVQFQNDGKFNIRIQILPSEEEERKGFLEIEENKAYEPKVLETFQNICCKTIIVAHGQKYCSNILFEKDKLRKYKTYFYQSQKQLDFEILKQKYQKTQIINSEDFLTDRGCVHVFRELSRYMKKKVVIIGDSDIALACANLLLNGPKLYSYDEQEANSNSQFAFKRKSYKCKECFTEGSGTKTPLKSQNITATSPMINQSNTFKEINKSSSDKNKCNCFGNIDPNQFIWRKVAVSEPKFSEGEIIVAHNSEIKIHFASEKEAIECNYSRFSGYSKNQDGEIHEFTGLRSPLRDLFYDIIEGYEKRVELEPFKSEDELEKVIGDSPTLIINASGFESTDFTVKDLRGNIINLLRDDNDGIFTIDEFCRLQSEKGSMKSIFGIGDNFALPTTHPMIQSETHKSKIIRVKDWRYYNSVIPDVVMDSYFSSLRNYREIEKYIQSQESDFPIDAESFNSKSPQKHYYKQSILNRL